MCFASLICGRFCCLRNLPSSPACDLWRGRIITSMQRMFKVSLPSTHSYISNFFIHFQACALLVAPIFFFFFLHTLTISASHCVCIQYISFSLSLCERIILYLYGSVNICCFSSCGKNRYLYPKGYFVVYSCFLIFIVLLSFFLLVSASI